MNTIKDDLIAEIDKRVADKILEPANAELLKKLILQADDDNEAMSIAELGTTYKRTGLHFDKRLERICVSRLRWARHIFTVASSLDFDGTCRGRKSVHPFGL